VKLAVMAGFTLRLTPIMKLHIKEKYMLESILFTIQLSMNAVDESKLMHQKRQEQNRCLAAKECVAIYDNQTQAWIVRKINKENKG
jgi:hypothetical protein